MVTIRRATAADSQVLATLVADVQQLHADALPTIYKPVTDLTLFIDDVQNRLLANPDGWVYIAEVAGQAVGYVYVVREERPETPYTFARSHLLIDQIAVKPAYQGQGYGQALMRAICNLARAEGIAQVTLRVMEFNAAAIGFYQHLGFEMFSHGMVIDLAVGRDSQ